MGAGASKDGEEVEVDDRYVTQSQSGSASGPTSPRRRSVGQVRQLSRMSMSKNVEGQEEAIIAVTRNGFSVPEITVMEGQSIIFVWQEERMDIVQVIHDGEKLRPVIGGFSGNYNKCNGQYQQQFNLEGEYKFALSGIRCTPLLVTVRRRTDIIAEVTDDGFQPDIIYIDQGHSIKWQWKECSSPHSVQEVKYEIGRACFKKDPDNAGNIKTVSGSYRHQFLRPGLYFFMTEGSELGRRHFCAVKVHETQREFKVEILDRSYQPMILLIEEGDRVWWGWDKQKCKKHHSVYQIEAPALNQSDDDPYIPVKDGFRWTTPSKQGLMSCEFFKAGVYYFSDQNFQEAAEYIGTIIVKPKQKEVFAELTESGFNPDLVYAQTGDRIWWTWNGEACVNSKKPQLFALMETDTCLNPMSRKSSAKEGEEEYQYLDDESLALVTKVGLATTHFSTIGVYHYRVAESPDSLNTCSVIVNPGPKNHTIHLTDNGFEPKVITVRPNDRVWWVWQSGKKQHNILQVSHQGDPIENGFCSGSLRDAPSAFVHQFMTPGVFYFLSHSLPKLFGAIVVSTQPQVHEVNVGVDIKPDPVTLKVNDIVCWIFRSLRQYNVSRVESIDQIAGNEIENVTVPPRRCMSKAITRTGVQHFYSRSFTKGKKEKENYIDDIKISSVVCDERYDNAVVRVDKNGFHPAVYYIQKSQSVMWVWKGGEDEAHNVIHVKSPDSDEPLNVIHGAKSFNSGKPVPNNSFLYTFDEDGSYTVASQGAPGFFCTIVVLDVGMRVKEPFLDSSVTGGTVDPGTKVYLSCDTPGSRIFYTTDGSPPELHQESVKLYRPENGIVLHRSGLAFVRAMATKEGRLNSHIYTSNRFWVMGDGDDDRRSMSSELSARVERQQSQRTSAKTWDWWGCIPAIKACFTNPGTLEVFWDPPEPGHLALIKGYQLYLNGVSYCDMFPPNNNSLRVSGMAGGRVYDIVVEVYSKKPDCQPQKSNKLRMKCPLVTASGGPVISLERSDRNDTLAIVWMSIDTPQNPISGYLVFLNDQQCGKRLVPDPESNRCKVVIGSCEVGKPYLVYVVAIPADTEEVVRSNTLEVILPLDASEIRLPPRESRTDAEELYLEYLEVNEGSGYLPAMDNKPNVYSEKGGHSFITESIEPETERGITPPPPLSPIVAKREKAPILPKESRPPPVIYDAATGGEVTRRGAREVEESKYRDGVVPLRKDSAKLRSKSSDDETSRKSFDRISSGISSSLAHQRSRSHSPTPRQEPSGKGKLSFRGLGQAVRLGTQKIPKLDLTEQTKTRALTFKTVCKAIIGFIRQEKLLRIAIGPVKLQQPKKYNLKRLKTYVDKTKAFTDALSKTKEIEIVAPGSKSGTGKGMAGFFAAAKNIQHVKKLGAKKGGFVKQSTTEQVTAPAQPQAAATPGPSSVDTPGPSGRPTRDEGYASNQEYERDRRFPPDFRYPEGFPRDPRDRFFRDFPYHGRYTPPWQMRYREEYEDYLRWEREQGYGRERDQGYDTMGSRDRKAVEDYYRRDFESDRNREYYRRKLAEEDQEERQMDYSRVPHGERYKLPPSEYASSRRRSMRSPDDYPRDRSYSPAEDRNLRFYDSSPEDTQRSRRNRGVEEDIRSGYKSQRDRNIHRGHRSPEDYLRKDNKRKSERRKSSPGNDTIREANVKTPEEYRWGRGREERQTMPRRHSPRHMQALKYSRSFDRNYREDYERYKDPREDEAKMRAIAVYANAMGGVNDEGDQSVMTDDNEKSTQTSSQTPQKPRYKPQLDHDFIPPSLQEKGVSPRGRRRPAPDYETETETETETESETEEDRFGQSQSMVVMDAQKPQAANLAVRKKKSPRTPRTPKSGREYETPRQRGVSVIRDGREYIEVEDDGTTTSTDREALPRHPQAVRSFEKPRKRRRNMAIIEVQDAVELDAKKNEESMEEERQVAVPAVTKESMRQIDEGQFITSDGDGILPAPSIMVESHGKSGVRVIWDLPRQPDPEYHLLLYVVNVVGTRFTGDINSDISFECNIVEKGKQVRGVQHCWNIQDKNKCTVAGLVPGLTYRLYVIANYTLVHGQQPCEIQTTSSVIYYTTVGPPRPPKLRVVSVDMHQALLEWEPPRLDDESQLKGYQIYIDNKPLGGVRNKETRQMMVNNLVPGKTLSAYIVAVTKQANQESDPSRVIHITCPREPPGITVAQQPTYKQGCVLISWDRPKGHTFATNEEDISLYGDKHSGSSEDSDTGHKEGKTSSDLKRKGDGLKGNENVNSDKTSIQDIENDDNQNSGGKHKPDSDFERKSKTYIIGRPKQKAVHKGDVEGPLEISDKHVRGHGYKRTKGDRDDGFKNKTTKHSEGKKRKSEKEKKHKHSSGSSSDSSSSHSSQSSSESETDDSREHHMNGYKEYTGMSGSDIDGDINDSKGIHKHSHDNIRVGWDDDDKQISADRKRYDAEKFRVYPGDGSEKAVIKDGKIVRGHGYKEKRNRLKDRSENVSAGRFDHDKKKIKDDKSTSSSSSSSSSSRSSSISDTDDKRQPFAGDYREHNDRHDKRYDRGYHKGSDESYDRRYDGGYEGMYGRGFDNIHERGYDQRHDDKYGGGHDKTHDGRYVAGYDKRHDDIHGRGHDKAHDNIYITGYDRKHDDRLGVGHNKAHDNRYDTGYDKRHDDIHSRGHDKTLDNRHGTGYNKRHDDRYVTGNNRKYDDKYVKGYDRRQDDRFVRRYDKTHDDRYIKGYDQSHGDIYGREFDDRYDRLYDGEYDDGRYDVGDESDLRHSNIEPYNGDIEKGLTGYKHTKKRGVGQREYKNDAHVKDGSEDVVRYGNEKYIAAQDGDMQRHLKGNAKVMQRNHIKQIRADIEDGFQGKVKSNSRGVGGHGYKYEREQFDDGRRTKGGSKMRKRRTKSKMHEGMRKEREGSIEAGSDKSRSGESSESSKQIRSSKRKRHESMKKEKEVSLEDISDKSMSGGSSGSISGASNESLSQKRTGLERQNIRGSSIKHSDRSKSKDKDKSLRQYDIEPGDMHVDRGLRGFKSQGKRSENLHKGKTKGLKKTGIKDGKKGGLQKGSASQDNYFKEVSTSESEDVQNLRQYRDSPEVAFEGAFEIGSDGHVKGHGYRRIQEGQPNGVKDKGGKDHTRQKHLKSKALKVDSDKDSSSSSVDSEHIHDNVKSRTQDGHFEEDTKADNVGVGGLTALEKASKIDTTGLHGNRNAVLGAENKRKGEIKGSKKTGIRDGKGHSHRKGTAGKDDYFEDVSTTDTESKQKQTRQSRASPDVAFEDAVEIGSGGHIKGHGYMRTRERQSNDTKNKHKYATGHKHSKNKASKNDSDENSSGRAVDINHVQGHDNDKFRTQNNYSGGVTKAYSEGIDGFKGIEKASKLDTTGLHGDRNALFGAEENFDDDTTKAWSKRGKKLEERQQSKTDHEHIRDDDESLVGKQTETKSDQIKGYPDKQTKKDHETGVHKTDKKGSKKKKSKHDREGRDDYLKDRHSKKSGSSSSESSSSSSDSDTDFSREEIIDDGRIYTIRVESSSEDDNENIRKHRTVFYNAKDHKYSEGYITKDKSDKHKESVSDKTSQQGLASKEKSSEHTGTTDAKDKHQIKDKESKVKFDELVLQNNADAALQLSELKRKYDDSTIKDDSMTLQEIKEFKDSNMEDIGNVMKFIKSIDTFGPRESSRRGFIGGQTSSLMTNGRQDFNKFGMKDSDSRSKSLKDNDYNQSDGNKENERFLPRLYSGQSKQDSKGKHFLEHLIEIESDDSRQRNLVDYNKFAKTEKSLPRKLSRRGKIKSPHVGGNKGLLRKKVKGIAIKDATNFRGSRVNPAFRRSIRQSPRGKRKQDNTGTNVQDSKGNKGLNTAQTTNGDIEGKYLQNFRGISNGGLSGRSIEKDDDSPKEKPGVSKDTGSVYVDGKWYGEVKSNKLGNKHGYQYILNDLNPEQSYDVNVKAIAGYKRVDPDAQHIFCLSDGPMSNTVPVMAPAAPKSPKLRLEGLHPEGIDVTWLAPQQHGEAAISGYQMLKNGRLYGSIIPPEVNSLRIRDISLGEKITLQLIALTEHPVGKVDRRTELLEKDSGIDGSSPGEKDADVFIGEKYAGCRPGAKLVVHYTGLVMPPSQVWCERVTGHSALIVWNRDDEPKAHFIRPESYQVTWWPGDHPEDDIQSDSTSEDHLLITNLRPAKTYTVVVEARKMEKYKDVDEEEESVGHETISAFILTAKSDNLILKTARPPDAPSNLGALATTCSAIKLAWDPPREHGVDIIGIRLDAVSLNTGDPHHVSLDVIPDATTATIEGLREKTDYMIRVTAITDEYFDRLPDRHRFKKARTIPKETILPADDSPWLPNCSILTKTSGTEPPAALKVAKASTTSLKLVWTPPIVYGSNKLQSVIVRWADVKYNKRKDDDDFVVASHVNLLPTEDTLVIEDLMPGNQYKIIIEAVVSVKTSLEKDDSASGIEKYRRTAHIMSRPLYARTRAPTEPPVLLITGYTQTTAQLYWEKPLLMSVIGKDAEGKPKYLRRYLEGYKLEINGKTYCHLGPASQSCQLTKCKPGKLYHVTLVALTCTEQGKKERKRKYKGAYKNTNPQDLDYGLLLEDEDNLDASPSEPLEITLPKNQDGYVASLDSFFTHNEDRDSQSFGDIKVQWNSQGPENTLIKQHNIIWYSHDDRVVQTKYVSPDFSKCSIPVTRLKSCYDIVVEPAYFTETLPQQPQNIQIMIPGPPDPPEIFLKSSSPEEFVIEWGEPRLFGGVKVRGYQVYMNDKKAGNELSSTHRKAVVPCRPNRYYKVNLVALSANPEYHDSGKSNTLSVNTSLTSPREGEALDELTYADDHEIPVKVTKVTETSIHLDWVNFMEVDGVGCYKIQWSSVAQPAEREVRLSNKDSNCVINKCLPGTTHFVRLLALDEDGQIKERSKQLTVQTSAPPDGPNLSLRACNFRYIAIQWDKPNTYGDALITGYKVYVNGIVEAIQNADQLSYTFTHGKWCQEYSFQVQALTSFEKMNSKPSEPLVVEWPGAKPPTINRLPTHTSSNLRVGWDDPYLTEGVKLKHFRVCCIEEDTEKMVSSIGPVHPDTREAEFKQIKKGSYNVYVEVHLYGTSEVVCSDPIKLQPAPAPDAPRIAATVVGFDERRLIEKITCDLVNKRDRLIRQVGHKLKQIGALTHPLRAEKDRDVIEGAHTLTRVEELLEDCFSALENYTGQLIAHVSWQCEQSNPDIQVSGYKVLIDGKQYGNAMHEGVKTVRIKLGTEQQVFRLSMVSLTDKPNAASEESNIIDLLSETFRCFSFYCYHSIHTKGTCWPDQGCCKYQDSIAYERQLAKKLANQGLLKKHVPPPSCSLLDIFEGEYKPLLQSHNRQYPTVILFWTPWCLPSQKIMTYFTRFARETTKEYNFVAVACGMNGSSAADRKALIHLITANSWREDGTITHYTSQCASSIYEATNHIWKNTTGGIKRDPNIETESNVDLTDLLGIAGVPTFLFIHQEGYIAWHGRYSAYDYGSYAAFMRHTFSEVAAIPCPVFKCDCCRNDTSVDDDTVDTILQFANNQSPFKNTTVRPQVIRPPSPKQEQDDIEKLFVKRKHSPKRKQKNKLTVNQRPYSAHTTTYAYLLKSPYMERLTPSPKTHKILMRPASSRNVQTAYETL